MNPAAPDPASRPDAPVFRTRPEPRREFPLTAIIVAGGVIVALLAAVLFFTRGRATPAAATAAQPLDPYAANLPLSGLAMSESTSLSGGKSTFLDGRITNTGGQTVTGVTVQVFFRSAEDASPSIETLPVTLVRTREPYVDTEPVSAEPLKPGDARDFRLIFETLPPSWNTELPEVHVIRVTSR